MDNRIMKSKTDNTELPPILVRLQEFAQRMGLTMYQINKEAGLCKGLLINAYSKHQGLTTSTLEAILNAYPQLNANWLISGRGEMLCATGEADCASLQSLSNQYIARLDQLQSQVVSLLKTIQQLKQEEQAAADKRLLEEMMK